MTCTQKIYIMDMPGASMYGQFRMTGEKAWADIVIPIFTQKPMTQKSALRKSS